ncbi:MAG: hypothetical protein HQM06_02415 [Magnetococcales bacterium]|nr:hypothetical protein [Magnetococcales bacterium]
MPPHSLPWLTIGSAMAVTLLLLAVGIPFAHRVGWLDYPNERKPHQIPVPMVGGVAMFGGLLVGGTLLDAAAYPVVVLGLAATLVVILGCLDDCRTLSTRIRLLSELLIALLLIEWGEIRVLALGNLLGTGPLFLQGWSAPFTALCFIGTVNAINMSDGSDGLAAGQTFVSLLCMLAMAVWWQQGQEASMLLLVIMVVFSFLLFNAPLTPRRTALTFMGDAGSKLLGLALFLFTVHLSQKPEPLFSPVTALWLLALPLMELFGSILRRLLGHQSPFHADKGHIHHRLQRLGYNKRHIFFLLTGFSLLCAAVGCAAFLLGVPDYLMFYGLLLLFAGYCWFVTRHHVSV